MYEHYNLQGFSLQEDTENQYSVYIDGNLTATVKIEKKLLHTSVTYYWDARMLEERIE